MIHKPTPENIVPGRWLMIEGPIRRGCLLGGQITRMAGSRIYFHKERDFGDVVEKYISLSTATAVCDTKEEAESLQSFWWQRREQYNRECSDAFSRFNHDFLVRLGWKDQSK